MCFVLCMALCTTAVLAQSVREESIVIPYELIKDRPSDCKTATLFGEEGTDVYEEFEERIVDAVKNMETEVNVLDLDIPLSSIMDVVYLYADVMRNHPYYGFLVDISGFEYWPSGTNISYILIKYKDYDEEYVKETQKAIDKATAEILHMIDEDMTDFQKVMTVHDYMVLNYEYDARVLDDPDADVVRDITMMLTKKGVCMGYSYAFKHVMNELGIECGYVESDFMNHEWNIVKIDGEWYHIDVTQDDPLYGGKYDMFAMVQHRKALLSSEAIDALGAVGYVLPNGVEANSKKYDDAPWKTNSGAVVTLKGVTYYVDGNNLVDETGKVIYRNLARNYGRWNGIGAQNQVLLYTGIASYYGKLYFNTENAIYSYDPETGKSAKILVVPGIFGMYIDGDTLYYGKAEINGNRLEKFSKHGEEDISYMRIDEVLVKDVSDILVTFSVADMTYKQKVAANVYTDDEEDGIVKINIKDVIKMAQIIATKKN